MGLRCSHADNDGALVNLMNAADGDCQTYRANDGAYVREHFFGRDPRTARWSRTDRPTTRSGACSRGGHDYRKVYAAYRPPPSTGASRRSSSPRRSRATHVGSTSEAATRRIR